MNFKKIGLSSIAGLMAMTLTMVGSASASSGAPTAQVTHASSIKPNTSTVTYKITITTGTISGAGTDANITIGLYGSLYYGGEGLDTPNYNDFEAGETTSYYYTSPTDLGNIQEIEFDNDGTGSAPDWYVSKVTVQNMSTNQIWTFNESGWVYANSSYYMYY